VVLACMLVLAPACEAHGFMSTPRSRVKALGMGDWEASSGNGLGPAPFPKYPNGNNINDQADACGDPHQEAPNMNIVNRATNPQATYVSGSIVSITTRVTVHHGGWLGFKVCNARTGFNQACFDANPLVNADTGYQRWWMQSRADSYTTRWRLPAGFSCEGGCVLQMTYRTANSCVDSCGSAECGQYSQRNNPITNQQSLDACGGTARTEIFRDCADIKITGTSGGGSTGGGSTGGGSTGPAVNKCDKCNSCKCNNNCDCITGNSGSSSGVAVADWGQCGGKAGSCGTSGSGPCVDAPWSGYYCSAAGSTCKRDNEWWFSCKK